MKNVITLGKLIRLLLSSFPLLLLLSVNVHTKDTRNELARLIMGTTFLVYIHMYSVTKIHRKIHVITFTENYRKSRVRGMSEGRFHLVLLALPFTRLLSARIQWLT